MLQTLKRRRFERLTLPYLHRLVASARRRGLGTELAEDLVQDTYLRAWEAFPSLKDEAFTYTWLYRILLNLIADHTRRERRRQTLLPITDLEEDYEQLVAGDDDGPFELLMAKLDQQRVRAALTQLPDEFANALVLHDLEGFCYREIAVLTDVPVGTVMSRISRARHLLAAIILQEAPGAGLRPSPPVRRDGGAS